MCGLLVALVDHVQSAGQEPAVAAVVLGQRGGHGRVAPSMSPVSTDACGRGEQLACRRTHPEQATGASPRTGGRRSNPFCQT